MEDKGYADQYQVSDALEKQIQNAMEKAFNEFMKVEEDKELSEDKLRQEVDTSFEADHDFQDSQEHLFKPKDKDTQRLTLIRRGTISGSDMSLRFTTSAGLGSLQHNLERQLQEKKFLEQIGIKIKEAIAELKLEKVNS
mmetsp:Transcript_23295/g.22881  ORF Transcript_23295/g.22881 Transcript_23295/m.22881 type:complete len:139 (+) Transcript_23295:592-1008(+)